MHLLGIQPNSPHVAYDTMFGITSLSLWEKDAETGFDGLKTWYFQDESGKDLSHQILTELNSQLITQNQTISTLKSSHLSPKTLETCVAVRLMKQKLIDDKFGILEIEKIEISTNKIAQPLVFLMLDAPLSMVKYHKNLVGYQLNENIIKDSFRYGYDKILQKFCEFRGIMNPEEGKVEFRKISQERINNIKLEHLKRSHGIGVVESQKLHLKFQ